MTTLDEYSHRLLSQENQKDHKAGRMAKVLITGIAGFIGSSLARALLEENASVRGLDNLSTGKLSNIEAIQERIDFRRADILERQATEDACKDVDFIFHAAAIPSVPVSVADPVGTNGSNLDGTLNVLEAARKAGVQRLVYSASSAAYGDAPGLPKVETMVPAPISPYAVQKLAGEYYLASYAKVYGLPAIALRYFNVFGPRQDPTSQYSGVLARFISTMMEGHEPTIYGDGSNTRDFVYVDDVVSANLLAARTAHATGQVFNIASGRGTTLMDLFKEVKRVVGYEGNVNFAAAREGDIKHSVADITSAQNELGYRVQAELSYGIAQTVEWYQGI
jgi:UDP-glucose 4-epimerase